MTLTGSGGLGRVCVPIDSQRPEDFDPMAVPTVTELLTEIDVWEKENGSGGSGGRVHGMQMPSAFGHVVEGGIAC